MHDLSIRKVPGVGRVNERLLESIGIKVTLLNALEHRIEHSLNMTWTRLAATSTLNVAFCPSWTSSSG